jgi:hypothetical protein
VVRQQEDWGVGGWAEEGTRARAGPAMGGWVGGWVASAAKTLHSHRPGPQGQCVGSAAK